MLADRWLFRGAFVLVAVFLLLPILVSFWLTGSAALGHLPAIGANGYGLAAAAALMETPGLARSILVTCFIGGSAALLSLILAICLVAALGDRPFVARVLTPFLAVPHAAVAVGLGFLLAPSGWIARLLAPLLGWQTPPDLATVNDAYGLALILGLTLKEMPFLVFITLSALRQIPLMPLVMTGRALGYGRAAIWAKVIFPQIWPLLRLPFLVVLAYGLSVIDMAMILGPTNPPTFPVLLTRLFASPDVQDLLPASAGAILMLLITLAAFGFVLALERVFGKLGRIWVYAGGRGRALDAPLSVAAALAISALVLGTMAMAMLGLWSQAWRWSWPQILPQSYSLTAWRNSAATWALPLANTVIIALVSTALALLLAIAWLEGQDRRPWPRRPVAEGVVYLPLLVPQISFMFGMNILMLRLGAEASLWPIIWAHGLFVFPYVLMALSDPWRALDPRYLHMAKSLGAGPLRQLWAVKLPILLAPILAAAAIGVAVSVAQYLPTLVLGAGRVATLTTEAVALSSSSDRRITGVVASLQALVPLLAYAAAMAVPAALYRNRRHLSGKTTA